MVDCEYSRRQLTSVCTLCCIRRRGRGGALQEEMRPLSWRERRGKVENTRTQRDITRCHRYHRTDNQGQGRLEGTSQQEHCWCERRTGPSRCRVHQNPQVESSKNALTISFIGFGSHYFCFDGCTGIYLIMWGLRTFELAAALRRQRRTL